MANLRCGRLGEPMTAFGLAARLLCRVEPFASYRFGGFAPVLLGQIRREHYVLTFDDDRREVVGYFGWALCSEEVARAWVERNYVPSNRECMDGDCFVVATFHAKTREATFFQTRHVRRLYPGIKVFGRRDYGARLRPMSVANPHWDRD